MLLSAGWGYSYGYDLSTKQIEISLSSPLEHTSSSILDEGEALVFERSLYDDSNSYLELNQRLAQVLDIHKVDQRSAYCRVNEQTGDLIDVVCFREDDGILCTIERRA